MIRKNVRWFTVESHKHNVIASSTVNTIIILFKKVLPVVCNSVLYLKRWAIRDDTDLDNY